MKKIHIGRQCYTLRDGPEREAQFWLDLAKANKLPSVKQARAKANAGDVRRKFPRFVQGISTADYAASYYRLNAAYFVTWVEAASLAHHTQEGCRLVDNFFEPLNRAPSAVLVGEEVVEEIIEETFEEALA